MTDKYIRGATILWSGTFLDNSGAVSNPDTAKVDIDFPTATGRQTATATITQGAGNVWSGSWDSSVSLAGHIYWHVRAVTTGTQKTVQDGDFILTANRANKDSLTS